MQAKMENEFGYIEIDPLVMEKLAGYAATSCYGVVGMASRGKADGIVQLLRREAMDKGVKVSIVDEDKISIDLHIMVEYGINIKSISQSIMNRVRYFVESTTSFTVERIDVYVDAIRVDA